MQIVFWWQTRDIDRKVKTAFNRTPARLRLLTTQLALQCFRSEQGHVPRQLDDLVPKYLQRVPTDPFSNQPLVYRAQGTNWLLYSVGPDGVDDGGKPIGRPGSSNASKGDLFYDSPW